MANKKIEDVIKEIMQSGFDCAMGGDAFKSREENEKDQELEYDEAVKKYSAFIQEREREAYISGARYWIQKFIKWYAKEGGSLWWFKDAGEITRTTHHNIKNTMRQDYWEFEESYLKEKEKHGN